MPSDEQLRSSADRLLLVYSARWPILRPGSQHPYNPDVLRLDGLQPDAILRRPQQSPRRLLRAVLPAQLPTTDLQGVLVPRHGSS